MDLKKLTGVGFVILLVVAFAMVLYSILFGTYSHTFDWIVLGYWGWQLLVFMIGFGVGYYFWKQATASDWDAKFKDLVRKLLVENPQIRSFSDRLEESKQWLMK